MADGGEGVRHPHPPPHPIWRAPLRAATLVRTVAAVTLAFGLVLPSVAAAQEPSGSASSSDELERERDRAASDRAALRSELEGRRGQLAEAEEQLAAVGARVLDARGRLRAAEGQLALAEVAEAEAEAARVAAVREHERIEAALARTERELERESGRLAQQAVSAYKFGSAGARAGSMAFEMMRRAEDPNALAVGMKQISNVIDAQGVTVAEVTALRDERRRLTAEAEASRAAAAQAAADAAEQVRFTAELREAAAQLAVEVAEEEKLQAQLVGDLRAEADQTEAALARISEREAQLTRQLADKRAEEAAAEAARQAAAAPRSTGGGARSGIAGSAGGPAVQDGVCPVVGAVAGRDFSNDWGYPRSGGRTHQGNDIFADRGTPIVAIQDGVVIRVNRSDSGLGGLAVTYRTADGSEWYNAHLHTVADGLAVGSRVSQGRSWAPWGTRATPARPRPTTTSGASTGARG
jgi:septal ring factor EnvC (AmiA/AmiB activator)